MFHPTFSGGGIIRKWEVLFGSEGATQAGFLQLKFLMKLLADVEPSLWPEYFLVYDNICQVDQLKLLRDPLPMEDPFSMIWLSVTKAIDDLHDRGE